MVLIETQPQLNNSAIAQQLDRMAELLEAQKANPYRVRAYRQAADLLRQLRTPVRQILEKHGLEGLRSLPHIGESLSRSIEQLVQTGQLNLLEHLEGQTEPEQILATVPGVGPILAEHIHDELGVETLADLLEAAYDGRLAHVAGFGPNRIRAVRESLAGRFRRPVREPKAIRPASTTPPVGELLDVDREYREKVKANVLQHIAPKRLNPRGEAWLPVLHTERGTAHYTALFSNTARAHELGMTHDWVVLYRDDEQSAGQWTVITSRFGRLKGKRIVRGREAECETFYARRPVPQE